LTSEKMSRGRIFAQVICAAYEKAPQLVARGGLGFPNSGEVGLAIGTARRLRGEVRFAVRRSGGPCGAVIQPLTVRAGRCSRQRDQNADGVSSHFQASCAILLETRAARETSI
jgi:hypothetical protein